MKVEEIMTRRVYVCRPDDTLNDAARMMWDMDCGCVPVVDEHNVPLGVLTDRDICMAAYTTDRRLSQLVARAAMSQTLHTCSPGDPISLAEEIMRRHQIRRLPVVDDDSTLVGILSLQDLARAAVTPRSRGAAALHALSVEETLAAICKPRNGHSADA